MLLNNKSFMQVNSLNLGMRCKIKNVENEINLLNCHTILANKDVLKIKLYCKNVWEKNMNDILKNKKLILSCNIATVFLS